jgi:hypothetical protein
MTVKAADLPDSLKRPLLNQIREQVGGSDYDRMVGSVGEDGLLDILLNSAPGPSSSASSGTALGYRQNPWSKAWEVVLGVLGWNPLMWAFFSFGNGWGGVAGVLGFFVLLYFGAALFQAVGALSAISTGLAWLVGIVAGGAAVAGVGYVLWIGVPWVLSGVGQWWGWLGGHFR